jgi:hypothetical protein
VDPSRTPVHEPWANEPWVAEPSPHETPVPESSSPETPKQSRDQATSQSTRWGDWPPEVSGHADGGEDRFSDDSYSEGKLVEGGNVYQRGGTKLPPVPATREQRWLIAPNGEK